MKGGVPMGRPTLIGLVVLAAIVGVMLAGCGGPDVTFVSEGTEYTFEQVEALHASQTPPSSIAGEPVAAASELRREALVELRSRGGEAAEMTDFVTSALVDTGRSVLYYGEAASVEGAPAWVLLEAWGAQGGTLDSTRLWVFDRKSGAVVYSSTSR
jgi:hypothetical protein